MDAARLADGCVLWTGAVDQFGYPKHNHTLVTHVALVRDGRPKPPPPHANALHACDTPLCVNARHLSWGTRAENARQRQERKRLDHKGEGNPRHRLTEQDVHEVRRLLASGWTRADVARRFGVSKHAVVDIDLGRTWAWLEKPAHHEGD